MESVPEERQPKGTVARSKWTSVSVNSSRFRCSRPSFFFLFSFFNQSRDARSAVNSNGFHSTAFIGAQSVTSSGIEENRVVVLDHGLNRLEVNGSGRYDSQ